jgi:putative lipoprotein
MSRGIVLLFLFAIVDSAGVLSGQVNTTKGVITGTVAYRQRVALSLDAVIAVRLEDVSLRDSPAKVLSETIISAAGHQAPVPFELSYDTAEITPSHTYQVRATITANGTLLFTSSTAYRVLTHGAPSSVAIVLQEPGAPAGPVVIPLQETTWKLIRLGRNPVLESAGGSEVQIVLHKKENKLSGSAGCKDIVGTYSLAQSALKFTLAETIAITCAPEVMQQQSAFLDAIEATRRYRILGDTLELLLGNEVLARFQAQKKTGPRVGQSE